MMADSTEGLIAELKGKHVLRSDRIEDALRSVDRALFVPPHLRELAYVDTPLPIERGQTVSQPYTVTFMLEKLDVQPGQTIFEVGFGSGWQTALLAHLVGPRGSVYACELLPELCHIGRNNLQAYPELVSHVHLYCRSADMGSPEGEPFDRMIAAAAVTVVPESWRAQMKDGGKMLYPRGNSLVLETKRVSGTDEELFLGFAFVPYV